MCSKSVHRKWVPKACTISVQQKCVPKVSTSKSGHQKGVPKEGPKIRAVKVCSTSVHHKSAPQVCTASVHDKWASQVCITSLHHKLASQVWTKSEYQMSPKRKYE